MQLKIFGNNKITINEEGVKQNIKLILEIKSGYDSINDEVISNLIESFPSRLQRWIENNRDRISINFRIYYIFSHYLSHLLWLFYWLIFSLFV